jgi:Ca2+-binding EF-hand superfamily protein
MDFNKKGNSAGALDPTEFTVGLYNLCIMSKDLLEAYVFELYDTVHDGNLYQHQIETMVSESSPHAPAAVKGLVDVVFSALDKDNDGHISLKEFLGLDSKTESLLRPMYLMQSTLQKRCLGESFWDEERVRMQEMLAEYKQKTIIDLLATRVAAKYVCERAKRSAKSAPLLLINTAAIPLLFPPLTPPPPPPSLPPFPGTRLSG